VSRSRLRALLLAARPRTLTAALVPVVVGTALAAAREFDIHWWRSALALLGAGAIQIGTNLFNDVLDFHRGADTAGRLGPVRVTQAGLLPPVAVQGAAVACFVVAFVAGIPLVMWGGVPILTLGLLSLVFGYAYTGGPYPLAYHGLGELFVLLFFGLGAVGGTFWLQARTLVPEVALAGVQVGLLACTLLAINNLRDVAQDAAAGKHTLAVQLGPSFGRASVTAFALGPFVVGLAWLARAEPLAALLPFVALPISLGALRIVLRQPPGPAYNVALARSAGLQLAFGLLVSLGLAL
jgi:1,4-dihydroxy-2-naphthoate octaprenyltransferase